MTGKPKKILQIITFFLDNIMICQNYMVILWCQKQQYNI